MSAFDSTFVVDAIKLEEAAAEKRYFDGLIHDGIQCTVYTALDQSVCCVCCNVLCAWLLIVSCCVWLCLAVSVLLPIQKYFCNIFEAANSKVIRGDVCSCQNINLRIRFCRFQPFHMHAT